MLEQLKTLQRESTLLYLNYRNGIINHNQYKKQIRVLDNEIDRLELKIFKSYLQDTFPFEITSSQHPH